MQIFTFNIDQKISMWTRSSKHIEAETHQEAEQILKTQYQEGEIFESLDEYEYLFDTQEDLDVVEVLDTNGNKINFSEPKIPEEVFLLGLS